MPFIVSKVNVPITPEHEFRLKTGLGRATECIPGKTEASPMLEFEAECSLYLRGDNSEPMGYITVAVFANPDQRGYAQLSPMIAKLFHETLGIDPTSVFIKYEDISCWSIAGHVLS